MRGEGSNVDELLEDQLCVCECCPLQWCHRAVYEPCNGSWCRVGLSKVVLDVFELEDRPLWTGYRRVLAGSLG